jgi:hypothetical protein
MSDLTRAKKAVRARCTHRDMRDVVLEALDAGARFRLTKGGIIFYGNDGQATANAHYTVSDVRAPKNLRASLKRMGVLS